MFCSPCGTSSNYSSVSTNQCVTLCGAGISTNVINTISTYITNPFFSVSSINISTLYINVVIPSVISTFVSISDISIHISGPISTFVTNSNLSVNVANFPSFFSTAITNFPLSFSTFVTNSNLSVNVANFPLSFSSFVTNSNLSVNVANFPLSFSTFVTNSNLSVNVANFPLSFSTFVTNSNLSVNVANFPLSFSTFVTNSNLSVNVANFPSFFSTAITNFPFSFSTYITNPSLTVNVPSTISTYVTNPSFTVNIPSTVSTYLVNPCISLCGAGISTNITNSSLNVILQPNNTNSSIGTVTLNNGVFDTFSRLQTETPTTLFTAHTSFTENLQSIGYVSTGSGTFTFDVSNAIILMSTTGSAAGRAVRQTLEYQLYQPGKGHNALFTWTPHYFGTFDTSIAVRAGVYDDYRDKNTPAGTTGAPPYLYASSIYGGTGQETNQPSMGHYFEVSGNEWFVVERQNSPDNVQNIFRIPQSNWNGDRLNAAYGNNPSGYQLNADADNLFWIERQWLGVGLVRLGLYYNGKQVVAHQFGQRAIRKPYTKLNKLPIRYEIEKVAGGTVNTAVMGSMCMASLIDGDYTPIGPVFSLPVSIVSPTTRIQTVERPVLLIRLQQKYCRATIRVKDIEIIATNPGTYGVYKNSIITGPITWVNHPDKRSMVQYAVFANGTSEPTNTIIDGQCIQSGFFSQRSVQTASQTVLDLLASPPISSDVQGKPDVYCITMVSAIGNIDVNASCRWIEIT